MDFFVEECHELSIFVGLVSMTEMCGVWYSYQFVGIISVVGWNIPLGLLSLKEINWDPDTDKWSYYVFHGITHEYSDVNHRR